MLDYTTDHSVPSAQLDWQLRHLTGSLASRPGQQLPSSQRLLKGSISPPGQLLGLMSRVGGRIRPGETFLHQGRACLQQEVYVSHLQAQKFQIATVTRTILSSTLSRQQQLQQPHTLQRQEAPSLLQLALLTHTLN